MKEIIFVCTGNTCRSPMAEGLLKESLPAFWGDEISLSSAGTHAWEGQPASALAVRVLLEKGIDISRHTARLVNPDIINNASLVVALTLRHRDMLSAMVPGAEEWTIVLGELDPGRGDKDVEDPIGGDLDLYRAVRDRIADLTGFLLEYIADRFGLSPDGGETTD